MKINYVSKIEQSKLTLNDIKVGELFRPIDSRMVFMRLDRNGEDNLLTTHCSFLWESMFNGYIGEDFDDRDEFEDNHSYDDLILCAEMDDGSVCLMYQGIEVEKLNAEIRIVED